MDSRSKILGGLLSVSACLPSLASGAGAAHSFDQAIRQDGKGHAHLAFLLYRRAAEAGLPDAEFNVAVMLDSGRGVTSNIAQAATWYARAAAHGNHRAAYNLGQLYEAGEGVPKNNDIARAWFAASALPAARSRLAAPRIRVSGGTALKAPNAIAPAAGARLDSRSGGIELVWTAPAQPEPVRYHVEVRAPGAPGSHDVFSSFTGTSSLFARLPDLHGAYTWRVLAVARLTGRSAASDWLHFTVARN